MLIVTAGTLACSESSEPASASAAVDATATPSTPGDGDGSVSPIGTRVLVLDVDADGSGAVWLPGSRRQNEPNPFPQQPARVPAFDSDLDVALGVNSEIRANDTVRDAERFEPGLSADPTGQPAIDSDAYALSRERREVDDVPNP